MSHLGHLGHEELLGAAELMYEQLVCYQLEHGDPLTRSQIADRQAARIESEKRRLAHAEEARRAPMPQYRAILRRNGEEILGIDIVTGDDDRLVVALTGPRLSDANVASFGVLRILILTEFEALARRP